MGVSVDTVRRWDEKGILHSTRPDGKDRYFSVADLEKVRFSQPLTISEAAQKLDISEVTLRRLEEKGLITPDRDSANNRTYTLKCLENFIKSDYFLRRQEIEDKILSAPETTETKTSDYQNDLKSLSDQHRVLSAEIQKHNDHLDKLNRFRKSVYAALAVAGISLLILTTICTLFFIAYPEKTGRWFGLYSIKAEASDTNTTTNKEGKVLGATYTRPGVNDSNILGKVLQPIGGLSLEITKNISPDSYNRVVGQQAITDVNDVLGVNANNNVVSRYNLTFPDSSYLIIPDTNLIPNLNADYLRGKVPGTEAGNLAYYNEQGKITGAESNAGIEIMTFDSPMIYNPETKSLSFSYSSNNLTTENGQLTTIQGISTSATPTFAGITIGGINGILIASGGSVSSMANNSGNWDAAYTHTVDTNNPHDVTSTQILPNQTGQNGKILGTNGSNVVWTNNSMAVAWGAITGSLADQSDLNIALNSKEATVTAGLNSQYYRGDKTWQTLDKSAVGLGSVENTALSTWAGSANITTLGTIIAGTWNGAAIGDGYISSAVNWNTAFSHSSLTNNPHSVTKTQVGLGNVSNTDTTTTANITDSLDKRFVSDANILVLGNTSGSNTGDQTLSGLGGVATTTTVNGHALSSNVTVTATDLGLGSVENTALSTWAGSANITTLGTVATGTWSATAIGDAKISSSGNWNTAYSWGNHAVAGYFIKASDDLDDVAAGITNVHLTATLKSNYDAAYSHTSLTNNPHSVTASQVGLGSVDNTSDATKNVLSATKLTTARAINGVDFDGTGPITIYDSTKVPTSTTVNGKALSGNITLDTSDIADSLNKRYVTDANLVVIGNTSGTNTGDNATNSQYSGLAASKADVGQTMYIGTTGVAINRVTGALALAGVSIDGSSGSVSGLTITAGASISGSNTGDQTLAGLGGVPTTTTVNGHALSSNVTVTATDLGLGSVENTALSTWAGTSNITTLGTVATGTWNATEIADGKIATALTGKTYNALTLTAVANGFTIAGGTTSKTLTVPLDASVSGTNTGDQTLVGLGGVATTRNLTINSTTQDLSADRTWTITNISGNAATVTGLSIASGKTLTASNTLTLTATDGATLAISGGGTLGTNAYTSTAYLPLSGGTMAGAIAMGGQNITGGGTITGTAVTGTSFVIGANTLDTNEWAFLDGIDQALKTTSNVTHNNLTLNGGTVTLGVDTNFALSGGINGISFDTSTLSIDATNHRIGIGTVSPRSSLQTTAATLADSALFERTGTLTNTIGTALRLVNATPDEMQDGFGSVIGFLGRDIAGVDSPLGYIGGIRNGADDTGSLVFAPTTAGISNEKMRLTNTGLLGVGTTVPVELLSLASAGKIGWEASVGVVDTNLYRSAADTLKTDDAFQALSYNGLTVSSTTGTLTIASGKTLTASNSLSFTSTDGASLSVGGGGTLGTGAYATIANYALLGQTFYIGTTQVAINRASGALTLAGITLTTPDIGAATATSLAIGANTLTTAEWAFLDGQDQATKKADNPYWPNMISQAEGTTIEAFKQLATDPANIKGLWMFDQTGAVATLTDRSEASHTMDLSANASTLSPGVQGIARYITIAGPTSFYDTVDNADFSVTTDKFTIIWAGSITDATSSVMAGKTDLTTGLVKAEYLFYFDPADKLVGRIYDAGASTAYIGRTYNSALTADQNAYHVYAMTYSGGTTNAAVKLYRDGVQVDGTDQGTGSYTAAADTAAKFGSYYTSIDGSTKGYPLKGKPSALSFIKSEEWTATQIKRISTQLLGWGNNLP